MAKSSKSAAVWSTIRIENTEPGHFKFWAAKRCASVVVCVWGRMDGRVIAGWEQGKSFEFDSADEAQVFVEDKVESKLQRGYRVVSVGREF